MVVRYRKSVPSLSDMHEINNRAVFYSARISFQKWERNLEPFGLNSRRISLRSSFRNKVDSAVKPDATKENFDFHFRRTYKIPQSKKKKKTEVKRTKSIKTPLSAYKNKRKKNGDKETESIKIPRHNSGKWSRKRRRKERRKNQFLKISTIDEKKKHDDDQTFFSSKHKLLQKKYILPFLQSLPKLFHPDTWPN